MKRRPVDERRSEYEVEKAFLVAMWDLVIRRFPAIARSAEGLSSPVENLAELERRSISLARSGLRQSVSDLLEMSRDWTIAEVAAADVELRSQKAPELSKM